jgi:hypothetical protein
MSAKDPVLTYDRGASVLVASASHRRDKSPLRRVCLTQGYEHEGICPDMTVLREEVEPLLWVDAWALHFDAPFDLWLVPWRML